MKTIEQWLNELPEPYRSQALENVMIQNITILKSYDPFPETSLTSAIECAFSWGESNEGYKYWQELVASLYDTPPH